MAAPLREALKRPVCCTLQGEELFLERPRGAVSRPGARADPAAGAHASTASSRSASYCAAFMSELLEIPADRIAVVPLGISMTGYERRGRRRRRVPGRLLRARRPGKGTARAGRRLHPLPPPHRRRRAVRLEAAGYHGAGARRLSGRRAPARSQQAGLADEFTYRGARRSRGQARVPARPRRAVGAGDLRRAERDVPARGDGERRAGGAAAARRVHRDRREDRRRTARRPPDRSRQRWPTGCTRSGAIAAAAHACRRARSTACARTTRIEQSASRLLEVYEAVAQERIAVTHRPWPDPPCSRSANVSKEYPTPRGPLIVLSDVTFSLAPGEAAAITGPSGSGKSSLLYVLGALEPPSSGTVTLGGRNPFTLGPSRSGGLPQRGDRLRLPGPLPAAAVLGARERPGADAGRAARMGRKGRSDEPVTPGAPNADRAGRPRRPDRSPARRAVGRREAARRHRARADPAAAPPALRRADRQSRPGVGVDAWRRCCSISIGGSRTS